MSTERPGDDGIPADGPSSTSGPPSGPMASHLTLAASLGGPIIAAVSYGVIRVGYEEYFAALGLTPDVVGLHPPAPGSDHQLGDERERFAVGGCEALHLVEARAMDSLEDRLHGVMPRCAFAAAKRQA